MTVSNIQAYIDGDSSNKTTAVQAIAGVATPLFSTWSGTSADVDGEVTIVFIGDIAGTDGTADYVQTKINSLASDFTYNGYNGSGNNTSNALLSISDVMGAKLSN